MSQRDPIMQFFGYEHLPKGTMQETSKKFCELAEWVHENCPRCAERTVALRKILEGKDAAVRTRLLGVE